VGDTEITRGQKKEGEQKYEKTPEIESAQNKKFKNLGLGKGEEKKYWISRHKEQVRKRK